MDTIYTSSHPTPLTQPYHVFTGFQIPRSSSLFIEREVDVTLIVMIAFLDFSAADRLKHIALPSTPFELTSLAQYVGCETETRKVGTDFWFSWLVLFYMRTLGFREWHQTGRDGTGRRNVVVSRSVSIRINLPNDPVGDPMRVRRESMMVYLVRNYHRVGIPLQIACAFPIVPTILSCLWDKKEIECNLANGIRSLHPIYTCLLALSKPGFRLLQSKLNCLSLWQISLERSGSFYTTTKLSQHVCGCVRVSSALKYEAIS